EAGIALQQIDLEEMKTKDEIVAAIAKYAQEHPDLQWILGGGWQLPVFPDANPQKEWLDAAVPDRPVVMSSADGHSAWVNSKALALAGITRGTDDPANGRIERNSAGEPSGTLRESASDMVYRVAPKETDAEELTGLKKSLAVMNGFGITGF